MSEIEFEDVQVGDRIRVTRIWEGNVTAAGSGCHYIEDGDDTFIVYRGDAETLELLDRPAPPARCGDIREDPETGARYIRTAHDSERYAHWLCSWAGKGWSIGTQLVPHFDAPIIARLRPVTP